MDGNISYQMFEMYYRKAEEADKAGRFGEAAEMYRLAAQSQLKAAKTVQGQATRASMIERADKLTRLADAMAQRAEKQKRTLPAFEQSTPAKVTSTDESNTIWRAAEKPKIGFDDIAGLSEVKDSIRRRIIQPRQHPEIYRTFNLKVSGGILLYGPPGTGKTMIAKAVAHEVDAEFFSIRCSDIVDKYFGEAEKNIKSLFETARGCRCAVIFFDEFEALAAKRGGNSTVMNRLVPELLSQMDGFDTSEHSDVMILAATNRPWDIDSAFLRPPRLTQKIYVGLPDYDARLFLVQREFKGVPCDDDLSPELIAEWTDGYNAADIVALCGFIKYPPIDRSIQKDAISSVTRDDVSTAMRFVHSSVQGGDIERIRKWESTQGI